MFKKLRPRNEVESLYISQFLNFLSNKNLKNSEIEIQKNNKIENFEVSINDEFLSFIKNKSFNSPDLTIPVDGNEHYISFSYDDFDESSVDIYIKGKPKNIESLTISYKKELSHKIVTNSVIFTELYKNNYIKGFLQHYSIKKESKNLLNQFTIPVILNFSSFNQLNTILDDKKLFPNIISVDDFKELKLLEKL